MSENFKKLIGKNKKDYDQAAKHLIDDCDVTLFNELVENDSFLFDFVKQNVAQRISNAIDDKNYTNLLKFLKYYSPYYEDAIVNNLVKYANEDLTDTLLEKLENGTDNEKTYCAKYFAKIKDPLCYDLLISNAFSDNEYLSGNCAYALSSWQDKKIYEIALEKLKNNDDFEKIKGVKFLSAFGNKEAVEPIINAMKNSTMAENIAGEIPYLINLFELLDKYYDDGLLVINYILNGIGEILPLSVVFDFELFEVFERLTNNCKDSKCSIIILNAQDKFETLTENDEYLFDEDKETRDEIFDIRNLVNSIDKKDLTPNINKELDEKSPFVYTALEFSNDVLAIRELLKSDNQTLILRTAEILKKLGSFDETVRQIALSKVSDINIKTIIRSL